MKIIFKIVFIFLVVFFLNFKNVSANNLKIGKEIFFKNCMACHKEGLNTILPEKDLKKDTLKYLGLNNFDSIEYQIINGKNNMPAFGGRLTEIEIKAISNYILNESEKNFE